MQQKSLIAGRWLARVSVFSILLYGLLMLAVWTDTQHQDLQETQQLQLMHTGIDEEESATTTSRNGSIIPVNSTQVNDMEDRLSTWTQVSSETMLKTFIKSEGPSTLGIPQFTCLGWRQTGGCSPDGTPEPDNDANCSENIKAEASGYCLLRNEATGEQMQAMRVNCSSKRQDVRFSCRQAADFVRVAPQIDALVASKHHELELQKEDVTLEPKNGVLMVMYPKLLTSVYSTVRLLRSYNCSLPVELWYLAREMNSTLVNKSKLLQSLVNEYGPIVLREIEDGLVNGFNTKVYALAHSTLDRVLFLDADNSPVKDPTYLFTTPAFVETGAIFWPDFWHPANTIFNINKEALLWELVDTPYVDMFEQESGQLLIDRRRATIALHIVQFLAFRKADHFKRLKLLHGDKDLFRLAWLKTNTSFHMIQTPAAAAGLVNGKHFCGMTMVQHDLHGEILFLHHNGKKLIGQEETNRPRVWTHLQSFVFPENLATVNSNLAERYEYMATNYHVRIAGRGNKIGGVSMCYGDKLMKSAYYKTTQWGDLPYQDLEDTLHGFAQEAGALEKAGEH